MEIIELIALILFSILCALRFIYDFSSIIVGIFFPDQLERYENFWGE
jgi:hypothetical protein